MSVYSLRPVVPRDPDEHHRASTALELFFDLVIVIAIAAGTAAFHHAIAEGHGAEKLLNFVLVFFAIWWVWMNYTWFASAFDNDDAIHRLLTLIIMGGAAIFAAGVSHIFETLDFGWGLLGWVVMRVGMILLWARVARAGGDWSRLATRYAIGYAVAQTAWVALYFLVSPASGLFIALMVAVFAMELLVPLFADPTMRLPWHRHHMVERYGLLFIIVLGEILLSVVMTFSALYDVHAVDVRLITSGLAGLVLVFALWWLYFLDEDGHLPDRRWRNSLIWGYGHVVIFSAVALLGSGLAAQLDVISHHAHVAVGVPSIYVNAGTAVFMAALWVIRDRNQPGLRARAALPLAALLLALGAALSAPVELTALLAVVTLIARSEPQKSAHQ